MISYRNFEKTLKDISLDTSRNEAMTESLQKVVDFDDFSEKFYRQVNNSAYKAKSVDALCLLDNRWCMIEFKNGNYDVKDVRKKIEPSLAVFLFNSDVKVNDFKENSIFILVYNKENKDRIYHLLGKKANMEIKRFGVNNIKGIFFKDVKILDKEKFEQFIDGCKIEIPPDPAVD